MKVNPNFKLEESGERVEVFFLLKALYTFLDTILIPVPKNGKGSRNCVGPTSFKSAGI